MPDRAEKVGLSDQQRPDSENAAAVHAKRADLNSIPVEKGRLGVTKARVHGLLLVLLGAVLFIILGLSFERSSVVAMADFKPLFYGARCLLTRRDLYSEEQLQRLHFTEGIEQRSQKLKLANLVRVREKLEFRQVRAQS
jgi:hypothetical protein